MSLRSRPPGRILEPPQRSRRSEVRASHLLEPYLGAHVYLGPGSLEDQTSSPRGDGQTPQSPLRCWLELLPIPTRAAGRRSRGSRTTNLRALYAMSGPLRLGVTRATSLIIHPTVPELSARIQCEYRFLGVGNLFCGEPTTCHTRSSKLIVDRRDCPWGVLWELVLSSVGDPGDTCVSSTLPAPRTHADAEVSPGPRMCLDRRPELARPTENTASIRLFHLRPIESYEGELCCFGPYEPPSFQ